MINEKTEKHDFTYTHEEHVATQKDIKILGLEIDAKILNLKIELENKISSVKLELENKINSVTMKLGSLIVTCSGILFALLSYFHK